ncbi:MAG: S8 family serine peptidase [Myxococcales bacterium]|nr:S8 family serine peptidase [Myxococcales bacterium]
MQRRTVTKYLNGLCAAGAIALIGCQAPIASDSADETLLEESSGAVTASTAKATNPTTTAVKTIPDEYIVVFRNGTSAATTSSAVQAMRSQGATIKKTYSLINGVAGKFTAAHVEALRKDPSVLYVEPNQVVTASAIQNNAEFGIDRVDSRTDTDTRYNDFGFDGSGVHIFVLDTGIRTTHSEFTGRFGANFSAIDGSNSVEDCNGHGTNVASIAAGTRFGVAKRATVHSVRVLGCNGEGTTADVIEGLNFVKNVAPAFPSVANLSLEGPPSTALNDAVLALSNAEVPVVVAAGNSGSDACNGSPSGAPSAITVGAVDRNITRAGFSNFGFCVDIFAPGTQVRGAGNANDNAQLVFDGTSQAAPHVAGGTALYLQRFPRTQAAKVTGGILGNATQGIVGDARDSNDLFLFIDFNTPPQQSCFGRCGGQSSDFSCACDEFCTIFGDCCADEPIFCKQK